MVPGGLLVTSRTTRLTSGTSLVIRLEISANVSYGNDCRQDAKRNATVGGVIGALAEVGVNARYVPLNDIVSDAGKIAGAAQKRFANGVVLHHATMAYDIDADAMGRVLRVGKEKLSDKGTTSARKRVDPMRRQTGMERAQIIEEMKRYFASRYEAAPGAVTEQERERAQHLVETKFATPEWVARVP